MSMYCEKKENDWVKKCTENESRVPGQEVDQRKLGQRLCRKTVMQVNCIGRMPWIVTDERSR